jgi:rod shape-determining protein MreD
MPGIELPGLSYFFGPFVGMLLWLPLTFILLLPQYQPVDRDANRPI